MSGELSNDRDERIESIAEHFLDRLQEGEDPDRASLLAAHPDISNELNRRLLTIEKLHRVAQPAGNHRNDIPREIGRFDLEALLGRGTFGAVYRAYDPELDRTVAIKVPRAGLFSTKEQEERFLREARSASRLKHPALVQVHEIGSDRGLPFIVSDYVDGRTLTETLATRRFDFRGAAELAAEIADALDFAHGEKIVHRDVKPGNILIDRVGRPHLTDFGLARRQEGEATMTLEGQILGTPAYMSPEQAAGEQGKVDARSDIYSLGVVLYELLTGEPPFQGSKSMLVYQVLHIEPRAPRSMNPRVPRDLETICLKALEKEPPKRYGRAKDIRDDLRRFLKGEPIRARPVGPVEKLWRWSRRNPIVAGLTATVVLLLIVLSVGSIVAAVWFETQSQESKRIAGSEKSARLKITRQLARMNMLTGIQCFDDGDCFASLPFLARALTLDQGIEPRERIHRLRFASALARAPRIVQIWFHGGKVYHAVFSLDGRLAVTASEDKTAQIWDVTTGEPAGPRLQHPGAIYRANFSPDGRAVVTACADGKARIWDWARGETLVPALEHIGPVGRASFSPDGRLVVTASSDSTTRVWRAATGECVQVLHHAGGVMHAEFSPDSKRVVTASFDNTAGVWDAMSGLRLRKLKHGNRVDHAEFSPDGTLVVTASQDASVQIWNASTGECVGPSLHHSKGALYASFSPDSRRLVTSSWLPTGRIWEARTGEPLTLPLNHSSSAHHVVFSPDGRRVVTSAADGTARVWDAATGEQIVQSLQHGRQVRHAVFGPAGHLLLTASDDGTARLWDTARGQPRLPSLYHGRRVVRVRFSPGGERVVTAGSGGAARIWCAFSADPLTPWLRHKDAVCDAEFSPDGKWFVTASTDKTVRVWDASSAKKIVELKTASDPCRVRFSPDGRLLVVAERSGTVEIRRAHTGQPTGFRVKHAALVETTALSSDGRLLVTGSRDRFARVWVVANGTPYGPPLKHAGYVYRVSFSPDNLRVLTACHDGCARIWDARSGKLLLELAGHLAEIRCAIFSGDGRHVLTASGDGTALVWNAETGEKVSSRMIHAAPIYVATFSPDGTLLATASTDGTARVWVAATGDPLTPPLTHADKVCWLDFSPDSRRLATASLDGKAKLWDLPFEERPVGDLVLLARLLSGRKIDKHGSLEFLELDALRRAWESLRFKYPQEFTPSPDEVIAWHRRQWARCKKESDWHAHIFHLDRIVPHVIPRWEILNARALAYRKLGLWHKAAVDGARALQLRLKEMGGEPIVEIKGDRK